MVENYIGNQIYELGLILGKISSHWKLMFSCCVCPKMSEKRLHNNIPFFHARSGLPNIELKKRIIEYFFCLLLDIQMSRSKLPCRQVWVNWMNLKGQSISCAFILGIFLPGKKMYVFRALHSLFFVLEISSIFPCIIGTGESRSCLESSCDLLGKIHQNNFLFLPYLL